MKKRTAYHRAKAPNFLAGYEKAAFALMASILFLAIAPPAGAATTTLNKRIIARTSFQTQNATVFASCVGAGCSNSVQIFNPILSVICPVAAEKTCTIYAHLETQVNLTTNDAGQFRFLIDGAPPLPGPTDGTGLFTWLQNDPFSGVLTWDARSYAVVAIVTNQQANQIHTIQVNIGCKDADANGACAASSGFSSLEANVYTP